MNPSRTVRSRLSIIVLVAVLMFSVAACGGESEPEPTAPPEPDVGELLAGAGEILAGMSTMKFNMVDEKESGAKFFGTTFKSLEAEVEAPDSFKMLVDVEAVGLGFVQIEMLAVGDQAFMKLYKGAPWNPLSLDQVPFNFVGLGFTLRDLLAAARDGAAITGQETVQETQTVRVEANLTSDQLTSLLSTADPGHEVTLVLWIDETEHTLQQIRIDGQVYDDDAPETTRLLTIHGYNLPVEIQLPDVG